MPLPSTRKEQRPGRLSRAVLPMSKRYAGLGLTPAIRLVTASGKCSSSAWLRETLCSARRQHVASTESGKQHMSLSAGSATGRGEDHFVRRWPAIRPSSERTAKRVGGARADHYGELRS